MRKTREKEVEAILRLDGPGRFAHFIKRVVDDECAWSLWQDGWSLMGDEHGLALPLWPAFEYADACRLSDWESHEVRPIRFEELLEDLMPTAEGRGIRMAVFPTPQGKGVVVSARELAAALEEEQRKYS